MANFCSQCGASLPEDAKFCGKCGKKVEEVLVKNIMQPPADNMKKDAEHIVGNGMDNFTTAQKSTTANAEKQNTPVVETFSEKNAVSQLKVQDTGKINNQTTCADKTESQNTDHFSGETMSTGLRKSSILPNIGHESLDFSDNDKLDPANDVTIKEKFFNYKGRLNRKRYFLRTLIASLLLGLVAGILSLISPVLAFPVYILSAIVGVMLAIRRCHDLNKSGWFYLLLLIPIVNIFGGLYLLFAMGTIGPNQYGPDPLAKEHFLK